MLESENQHLRDELQERDNEITTLRSQWKEGPTGPSPPHELKKCYVSSDSCNLTERARTEHDPTCTQLSQNCLQVAYELIVN